MKLNTHQQNDNLSKGQKVLIICVILEFLFLVVILSGIVLKAKQDNTINLVSYPVAIDYGILKSDQIKMFDQILNAVELNISNIDSKQFSLQEQHEILTQLGLYYGNMEQIKNLVQWSDTEVQLDLFLFRQLKQEKIIIDIRIEEAIASLKEGSNKYKLYQISNYIANRIEYDTEYRNTIDALNGFGVCSSYAMLFYKMATRIGLQTFICYGYSNNGYHAWNLVQVEDKFFFYDITYYDNLFYDFIYLYSSHSWDREYQINNLWATDFQ